MKDKVYLKPSPPFSQAEAVRKQDLGNQLGQPQRAETKIHGRPLTKSHLIIWESWLKFLMIHIISKNCFNSWGHLVSTDGTTQTLRLWKPHYLFPQNFSSYVH